MATWSNTKNVGSLSGKLRVTVTTVSVSGNSTTVDVTGTLINDNNSGTASGTGVPWNISGAVTKPSANFNFSVGAKKSFTIGTHRAAIAHNADGTKTATVSLYVGATGTSTFGTPGTVSVTFTLPRIPKAPAKPVKPTISNVTGTSMRGNLSSEPNNNGAAISRYEWLRTGGSWQNGTTARNFTFTGLAPNSNYQVKVRARNSAGLGPESDWSNTITTAPNAPAAPTNVQVARTNDQRHTITWTRQATTAAPYTTQNVRRRVFSNGVWSGYVTVGPVSGTATSYVDQTTVPNRAYQYEVEAVNSSGSRYSAPSAEVRTTPAAPTGVTAVKQGNDIRVSWVPQNGYNPVSFIIEDSAGGGAFAQVGTTGNVSSWLYPNPDPAKTHRFRVITRNTVFATLNSAPSAPSETVQLLAPPNPPTLLGPTGVVNMAEVINFRWRHNPVDTTAQSAATLRYRIDGGTWVTLNIGAQESIPIPPLNVAGAVEWQVQTKGQFPSFGEWSATSTFRTAPLSTVSINNPPSGSFGASRVTAEWGFFNADGATQATWVATLYDYVNNGLLETRSGNGPTAITNFAYALADATQYRVTVDVVDSNGLAASDATIFTTDFPLPLTAEVIPVWEQDTGTTSLSFEVLEGPPGAADIDFLTIRRRINGGDWVVIANNVPPTSALTDYLPSTWGLNEYQAISNTNLPSSAFGPIAELDVRERNLVYFNTGPDFSDVISVCGEPAVAQDMARESALYPRAGASFGQGVLGTSLSESYSFSGVLNGTDDIPPWEDFYKTKRAICYRDFRGRRVFALLRGVSLDDSEGYLNLTVPFDRTHYVENPQAGNEELT